MTFYLVVDQLGTVLEETTTRLDAERAARQYRKASSRNYTVIATKTHVPHPKFW